MVRLRILLGVFVSLAATPAAVMAQRDPVAREVAICDDFYANIDAERYADVAAATETNGERKSLPYELAYMQKERRECLERARDKASADPAQVQRYNALIAANDQTLVERFAAAQAEFEKNVVKYLHPADYFGEPRLAPYKASLASARKLPDFRAMCGTFDFTRVPVETRAVNAARARHEAFKKCFDKFQDIATKISVNEFGSFQVAARRLAGTRKYTCSQWPQPNCVPDAEWKRFGGEIFTQKNRALVDAAEQRLDADQKRAYATETKVNEWVRELSGRINASNGY